MRTIELKEQVFHCAADRLTKVGDLYVLHPASVDPGSITTGELELARKVQFEELDDDEALELMGDVECRVLNDAGMQCIRVLCSLDGHALMEGADA